ncbi:ethanolamine utilization protein EutH [Bacillus halotolerans]|uniref:ethanolamine utilization protein EutH n=1 Tax=Bacillus halotolerans TaxID=260554 RepID=UPI002155F5DE|nr:ethanolamine utilization protein EutH [Bacillus halotolerans]MCR6595480.1 ethanolamine utilization protein EutH [Bacillus halotolerans]
MTVNDAVVCILAVFLLVGAADYCLGNRWGLGERFAEGFKAMGPLALSIVGIVSLAPVLARPTDSAGMVASLAHLIPMLALLKDMTPRGKVINVAFAVSAAFVLGSHLGFVAGMKKEMAAAMIIGKLAGGITAVAAAAWTTPAYTAKK